MIISLSCGNMNQNLSDLKPFPNSTNGVSLPEFTDRTRTEANLARLATEEKIGTCSATIYTLPISTSFADAEKFYNGELQNLGYSRVSAEPVISGSSRILFYKRNSQNVAVNFMEFEDYESKKVYPFIEVCIGK